MAVSEAFIKIDLHGMRREEAEKAVEKALASAGPNTYQIQIVHGFNRGTSLKDMIYEEFRSDKRVKRIMPGENQGVTVLVLKELF
jgi:DNA-nicking Smr family endonuclease